MRILLIGINNFNKIVWWKVDFGGVYSIYGISIVFRDYKEEKIGS